MKIQITVDISQTLVKELDKRAISIDKYINNLINKDLKSKVNSLDKKFYFDFNRSKLYDKDNNEIKLTKKELSVVMFLIKSSNSPRTCDQIAKNSWINTNKVDKDAVKNVIKRIRQKSSFDFIKTVYSLGYFIPVE